MVADPSTPPAGPLELSAGLLSLVFENGYVCHIRIGNNEIVRRIYMALRDENGNTIPGDCADFYLEKSEDSFSLTFSSRHRRNDIDFLWHAEIKGYATGELSFSMRGIALSGFRRNRIGFCVLHPLSSCKGSPCRVETADGATMTAAFPHEIAPRQIFNNVRSLTCPSGDRPGAEIRFEGDIFETEDQRNWTDASYKTYSTPLSLPVPVFVEKGATIIQKITVVPVNQPRIAVASPRSLPRLAFNAALHLSYTLPSIGMMAPTGGTPFDPPPVRHLRADLRPGAGDIGAEVDRAGRLYGNHSVPIELALHFSNDCAKEAASLAPLLAGCPFPIARFLVFHDQEHSTSRSTIAAVRETLRSACPSAPIVSGTDGYYVEINRVRPPVDLLDGVCWSANPQVHTTDDAAIMENLPGLLETLQAARAFSGGKKIMLSPLTLSPRKNPKRPQKDGGPDLRMDRMFGAAWLLGAIEVCIEGDASSCTLGEITAASPAGVLLSWLPRELGGSSSIGAAPGVSSDLDRICGFELRDDGRFLAFAANLTNAHSTVLFNGLPVNCGYSILDEESFGIMASLPHSEGRFREEWVSPVNGALSINLPGYAIVRFRGVNS